jgi:hypothetical protein
MRFSSLLGFVEDPDGQTLKVLAREDWNFSMRLVRIFGGGDYIITHPPVHFSFG